MRLVFGLAIISLGISASAGSDIKLKETAVKMVPGAKLVVEDGHEFKFQTAKGTIVEVELHRDGSIDEASGDVALNDIFHPGRGLLTLTDAINALKKAGKSPVGDWSFEKSMLHGWIYEFDGIENGKEMEYAIDATNGKLVIDRRDF